jgi:hypothetical protein
MSLSAAASLSARASSGASVTLSRARFGPSWRLSKVLLKVISRSRDVLAIDITGMPRADMNPGDR